MRAEPVMTRKSFVRAPMMEKVSDVISQKTIFSSFELVVVLVRLSFLPVDEITDDHLRVRSGRTDMNDDNNDNNNKGDI